MTRKNKRIQRLILMGILSSNIVDFESHWLMKSLVTEEHGREGRKPDEEVEDDTRVGIVRSVVIGAEPGVLLSIAVLGTSFHLVDEGVVVGYVTLPLHLVLK